MKNINLENMSDFQKCLLSELAYLNITDEGRKKILNGGIGLCELYAYLETPEAVFVADNTLPTGVTKKVMEKTLGEGSFMSHKQLLNSVVENGLGDLVITGISDKQNLLSNGFQALTFVDSYGNTGFSYRGSDFSILQGAVRDWVEADVLEYFTGSSSQVREMLDYFNKNKNVKGNNFLYGYSLGGNLVSHNYLHNYDEIREAFIINGNPINQKLLDNQEKIDAFNDPEKFNCNVVGGDVIGHLKSHELYKDNIRFINNSRILADSPIAAHMILSATFDDNGNFVYINEQEMKEQMGKTNRFLVAICQNVREVLNVMEGRITKPEYKDAFVVYKDITFRHFDMLNKMFGDVSLVSVDNSSQLLEMFQNADANQQQEFIDKILEYMENNMNELSTSKYQGMII